jgi:hypothetical protein
MTFENRELKKIFGPKGDDIRQERRRLLKEELYDQYCTLSPGLSKKMDGI